MKHLGDITKLDGHKVPLVDIVTGGSPCQDLSVAGKRAGLAGNRSGLFMEQIRIIKEMRDESAKNLRSRGAAFDIRHIRPRYMVWENVPGAFSSNKGEDFRAVLEETAKVICENAVIPRPENGKWTPSGAILGDGWSIAWRVHDAQFWGVPQRRKRISLVADFGGNTAPEILFERKSVSGNIEESGEEGQGTSTDTERGTYKTSKCLNAWDVQSKHIQPENGIAEALYAGECRYAGGESYVLQNKAISFQERAGKPGGGKEILIQNERTGALSTLNNQSVCYSFDSLSSNSMKSKNPHSGCREVEVSKTLDCFDPNPSKNQGGVAVVQGQTVYCLQGNGIDRADTAGCNGKGWRENQSYTLNTIDRPAVCIENHPIDSRVKIVEEDKCITQSVVRRLTPLEYERLQGYPNNWTNIGEWIDTKGNKHKDADNPRYKALGNSIALPFWQWMANRMVKELDKDHTTMASLFDGIGGFPLVYSRCGCEPVWASEIEEFPIAVTRIRFPDDEPQENESLVEVSQG